MTERPLQVTMIIQAYWPHVGGAERQLGRLIPLLRARNVEVQILTRRFPGLKAFEMVDGVPVYRLPVPGPKALAAASFTVCALPVLAKLRPHVIHAHEMLSPTTTALVARQLFGTPVVVKVLRGGALGDITKLQRTASGRRRLPLIRQNVERFIVISAEIEHELNALGVPAARQVFIPNGVDLEQFAPLTAEARSIQRQALGMSPEAVVAVFTGRLVPEKCLDQLIGVWPEIQAVHPKAQLHLIGTGPEAEKLRALAGPGVCFLGAVEDVTPYLQTADLFVLPSATEGLSNALLEAMAVGLPVIATAVGGAPDVITPGKNGLLIKPDTPAELRLAILTALADAPSCVAWGQANRARIARDYSLETTANRLRMLYEQLSQIKPSAHVFA